MTDEEKGGRKILALRDLKFLKRPFELKFIIISIIAFPIVFCRLFHSVYILHPNTHHRRLFPSSSTISSFSPSTCFKLAVAFSNSSIFSFAAVIFLNKYAIRPLVCPSREISFKVASSVSALLMVDSAPLTNCSFNAMSCVAWNTRSARSRWKT